MSSKETDIKNQKEKLLTLVFARQQSQILLGMKKRGFGAGRWNGFGGKVHEGETIENAARRELEEEAGLRAGELRKRGELFFSFDGDPVKFHVHVFEALSWDGEVKESEEMAPRWFFISKIPYDTMWPDDRYWLPLFLAGTTFKGEFSFSKENTIVDHTLRETNHEL